MCCAQLKRSLLPSMTPFLFLVLSFFHEGKSLVPEQTNEVEAGKRGAARGSGPGEGTGECEKGHAAPL